MQKKYIVRLTDAERETLNRLVKKRRVSAQKVRRAQVLLKADPMARIGPMSKSPMPSTLVPEPWSSSGSAW